MVQANIIFGIALFGFFVATLLSSYGYYQWSNLTGFIMLLVNVCVFGTIGLYKAYSNDPLTGLSTFLWILFFFVMAIVNMVVAKTMPNEDDESDLIFYPNLAYAIMIFVAFLTYLFIPSGSKTKSGRGGRQSVKLQISALDDKD